jgi:hypothetical protein
MKKLSILLFLATAFALVFCTSSKKTQGVKNSTPPITYQANVQPIIAGNCTPCHFPPQGNKKPYNTYEAVKRDIDEILNRVQKNPGDRGFMPARHPKLADSTIQVLAQWKNSGMAEK